MGALWGAAVGWWPVPVTPATMVTRPTVLGSYWPNLETPSLSSLQTSRLRRSTTTWKLRDPNHQPFGELVFLTFFMCVFGFCLCVCASAIVLPGNFIMWLWHFVLFICVGFSFFMLWSNLCAGVGGWVTVQSQIAEMDWVYFRVRDAHHQLDSDNEKPYKCNAK